MRPDIDARAAAGRADRSHPGEGSHPRPAPPVQGLITWPHGRARVGGWRHGLGVIRFDALVLTWRSALPAHAAYVSCLPEMVEKPPREVSCGSTVSEVSMFPKKRSAEVQDAANSAWDHARQAAAQVKPVAAQVKT